MTHTITTKVVRTSLSLFAIGAVLICPRVLAATPISLLTRWLPRVQMADDESDLLRMLRSLLRSGESKSDSHQSVEPDESLAEDETPKSFIETLAAEMEGHEVSWRWSIDSRFRDPYETPQSRFIPTWSNVWSDGAPLLLFDWSGPTAEFSGSPGLRHDGPKRIATGKTDSEWGALSAKVALREHDHILDPSIRPTWETDESLKLPVAGSLFLFGQLGASRADAEQRAMKWLGKTGVGVKLKPWLLQEVQVRGGPAVRYDDTGSLTAGQSPERSELFLEAITKVPLPVVGPLNLEYTSYAVPAATPADRGLVNQDLRVALPLSSGGQFHVGAKYRWEATPSVTPWVDRMQLYMGLQLKR